MSSSTFKNRTRFEILYEMIDGARQLQPIRKTALMNKSSMSYFGLRKFLDFALSQDLLEERILEESKVYYVTQKGFEFLRLYEELQGIISAKNESETNPIIESNHMSN